MSALMMTAGAWRATIRSVRWLPMLVAPASACLVLIVGRVAFGALADVGLVGRAGLVLTAAAAAFVVDDAAVEAAPASPVEVRARLAARAAVAVPVVVSAWLVVLAVQLGVTAASAAPAVAERALMSMGAGSAALAAAAVAARWRHLASPGAVGMSVVATLGAGWAALPARAVDALPPAEVAWPVVILAAFGVAAWATREPLDR